MLAKEESLSHQRLREALCYCPQTGEFRWLIGLGNVHAGTLAGATDRHGYVRIALDGVRHRAHRLAFFYMTQKWPENLIDHKNRCRSDNSWQNLRPADRSSNAANSQPRAGGSRFKGVSRFRVAKWKAAISKFGSQHYLGLYASEADAARAYDRAAVELYGEFAQLNFPMAA